MKRVNGRVAALLSVMLVSAACVSTAVTKIGTSVSRPQVAPESVVIYRTAEKVPGKYEEVALLNSTAPTGTPWTNEEAMYRSMRVRAGAIGVNGIILDSMREPSAGEKVAGYFLNTTVERKGKAIAIFVFPASGGQER
jgi:hypothetical protein